MLKYKTFKKKKKNNRKSLGSKARQRKKVKVKVLVSQTCLTLCNSMDCDPPGSSVHGILQARILSGLPLPSPGDLPDPEIKPKSPAL